MRRILLTFMLAVFSSTSMVAQEVYWPSPEVEQMYKQAKDYLSRGAINQSIILLQQAIQLAPDVMVLYRDLAQALNAAKQYDEAFATIDPIIQRKQADELCYQIAANALFGKGENKKARKMVESGLNSYPNSGILYHEVARAYEAENDLEFALDALLKGIQADPFYHLNYYEAARLYLNTSKPLWTVLYGEVFANMERHTPRSVELRKMMLEAYKKIFSTVGTSNVPKYGASITEGEQQTFEAAVLQVFMQLAPVMSDGITTENLIMLRTRFVMDWKTTFADKFPYTLFAYHDKLLREGQFDAYNQWLFGIPENPSLYNSWTQFHPQAISNLENWAKANPYRPVAADFYNTKEVRGLFPKKKKK
ncbi:MAG: hypothetical protein JSS64_03875 [Bacteroidetes bacterium]|nr:hypothetical protein [Bacteroidota bacterium]